MRPLLLAPLALGGFVLQQPAKSVIFPQGTVEARGGCEATPSGVTCWDMDGKPSAEIADALRAALSNNGEVSFRIGKKNRYVATRRPQNFQPQYRMSKDQYLNAISTYNTDPVNDFVRVAVEPNVTETTILLQMTVQSPKDEEVALREGAIIDLDGRKLEIGPAVKGTPDKNSPTVNPYNNQPILTAFWNVVMSLTGGTDPNGAYWNYIALDAQGAPIQYVDDAGKPITGLKALALEPTVQSGMNYYPGNGVPLPKKKPKAAMAFFQGGGVGAFRAMTNIDPKSIAKLRIKSSHTETKELGPFPLDPKK